MIGALNVRDLNPENRLCTHTCIHMIYIYIYIYIYICVYVCIYTCMAARMFMQEKHMYIYIYIFKYYTYIFPETREFSRSREDL